MAQEDGPRGVICLSLCGKHCRGWALIAAGQAHMAFQE